MDPIVKRLDKINYISLVEPKINQKAVATEMFYYQNGIKFLCKLMTGLDVYNKLDGQAEQVILQIDKARHLAELVIEKKADKYYFLPIFPDDKREIIETDNDFFIRLEASLIDTFMGSSVDLKVLIDQLRFINHPSLNQWLIAWAEFYILGTNLEKSSTKVRK